MRDYRLHLGKLVGPWFFACLFGVAAIHPNYSHFTKAVSELGAFGAPHAVLWNALGFFFTGTMIVLFGIGLQQLLMRHGVRSTGGWGVVALGVAFAATAIPADFELRMDSNWTIAHAIFVLLGPVAFIWAACVWPRALVGLGITKNAIIACVASSLLLLPAFASNAFLEQIPGVGQRLGFAVMFLWCWALSSATTQVDLAVNAK
ncbi:DUF998 domain-containing protein [Bythopirellula polymerisocia]|uniref:DUF998 domain-containing protein n=1 Tax=Bythopirellula polymerisocia TaxID=2528003 RepID=A0A5C6CUR7_9BACT|nr:DUF998 domain-containing protein [Bythopirellula polymerisocia]TWU28713.1 hypothetical protein Pla144_20050 [Bythopirellula polymerisocia]